MCFCFMRIPRRLVLGAGTYFHMTWRAHNGEFILSDHREKIRYLRAIRDDYLKNCKEGQFEITSFCIMSNHGHISGKMGDEPSSYSDHMRRAHSRFGMSYNRRHNRKGKVAYDRPYIKASEDEGYSLRVTLYEMFNPVNAGLFKSPTNVMWKLFSPARYFAYGESNEFSVMVGQPEWYLQLGKTPEQRQHKFRRMLDEYAISKGYKSDPKLARGNFVGSEQWTQSMKKRVRQWVREHSKKKPKTSTDPPDKK